MISIAIGFLFVQACIGAVVQFPGITYLGLSCDMHWPAPERPRARVFNFTGGNPYSFSATGALTPLWDGVPVQFLLPNEVNVQMLSQEESTQTVQNSYDEVKKSSLDSVDESWDILFGLIEFDITIRDASFHFSYTDMHKLNSKYKIKLFSISLKTGNVAPAYTDAFKADMLSATQYSYSVLPDGYMSFLEKYGTHYISEATFGAEINIDSYFQAKYTNDTNDFVFNLHIGIAGLVGLDAGFTNFETRSSLSRQSVSNYVIKGGIPDKRNMNGIVAAQTAADIQATIEAINSWKHTVFSNPAPISFTTTRISNLFTSPAAKADMDKAIQCFFDKQCYSNYLATSLPAA